MIGLTLRLTASLLTVVAYGVTCGAGLITIGKAMVESEMPDARVWAWIGVTLALVPVLRVLLWVIA